MNTDTTTTPPPRPTLAQLAARHGRDESLQRILPGTTDRLNVAAFSSSI